MHAREGEARLSRALVLAFAGRPEAGHREAVRAAGSLQGAAVGRALAQEAAILQVLGRHAEALDANRRALVVFRRHGVDDLRDLFTNDIRFLTQF